MGARDSTLLSSIETTNLISAAEGKLLKVSQNTLCLTVVFSSPKMRSNCKKLMKKKS